MTEHNKVFPDMPQPTREEFRAAAAEHRKRPKSGCRYWLEEYRNDGWMILEDTEDGLIGDALVEIGPVDQFEACMTAWKLYPNSNITSTGEGPI